MSSSKETVSRTSSIHLKPALARLGEDEELLRDLAVFYLEDCPILLKSIEEAIQNSDADLLTRSAHSLKGLSANFDAHQAVQTAQSLEQCGKNKNLAATSELFPQLKLETQQVIAALRREVLNEE